MAAFAGNIGEVRLAIDERQLISDFRQVSPEMRVRAIDALLAEFCPRCGSEDGNAGCPCNPGYDE